MGQIQIAAEEDVRGGSRLPDDPIPPDLNLRLLNFFGRIDVNQDGTIELDEIRKTFDHAPAQLAKVQKLFQAMDLDRSGDIDAVEFSNFWKAQINEKKQTVKSIRSLLNELDPELDLQEDIKMKIGLIFRRFDSDQSGGIDKDEIVTQFKHSRDQGLKEEIMRLFETIDVNKDGNVDADEFLSYWRQQTREGKMTTEGVDTKLDQLLKVLDMNDSAVVRVARENRRAVRRQRLVDTEIATRVQQGLARIQDEIAALQEEERKEKEQMQTTLSQLLRVQICRKLTAGAARRSSNRLSVASQSSPADSTNSTRDDMTIMRSELAILKAENDTREFKELTLQLKKININHQYVALKCIKVKADILGVDRDIKEAKTELTNRYSIDRNAASSSTQVFE